MAQGVSPLLSASAAIAGRIRFIRLLVFLITVVAGGAIADPPTEGSIRIGLIATAVLDPIGLCCASLVGWLVALQGPWLPCLRAEVSTFLKPLLEWLCGLSALFP